MLDQQVRRIYLKSSPLFYNSFILGITHLDNDSVNFIENLDFFANQVVEGFITGLHKSPFHGFSVEFAEHRMYNNGDSFKNIDSSSFEYKSYSSSISDLKKLKYGHSFSVNSRTI